MTATTKPMEGDLAGAIKSCRERIARHKNAYRKDDAPFPAASIDYLDVEILIRAAEENAALRARVRELEGVIYPFALAFHNAKSIHDPNTIHLQSHVVRATSFWLSYANFNKAQEAIKIKSGDVLGGGE